MAAAYGYAKLSPIQQTSSILLKKYSPNVIKRPSWVIWKYSIMKIQCQEEKFQMDQYLVNLLINLKLN